jgi:hypothetical protein
MTLTQLYLTSAPSNLGSYLLLQRVLRYSKDTTSRAVLRWVSAENRKLGRECVWYRRFLTYDKVLEKIES